MSSLVQRLLHAALRPAQETQPADREEKGYRPEDGEAVPRAVGGGGLNRIMSTDPNNLIPSQDRLLVFRTLTGIDTVPAINHGGYAIRSANNIGIYTRVVREERMAKKSYRIISMGIHVCLGLQIVIGACITAVAASNGSHRAITGLGAINTIFAGAMAYVKGSGYPECLKQHEFEWKKIREYVEQRERELCLAESGLDVYHEVRVVEEMYHRTKEELKLGLSSRDSKEENQSESGNMLRPAVRRAYNDLRPLVASKPRTPITTPETQRPHQMGESSAGISPIHDDSRED